MKMLNKLLRLNRRLVHTAYQVVFPMGIVCIAVVGAYTLTPDKKMEWSVDLSGFPTWLGYVLLYGACIVAISVNIEMVRKVLSIVRRKFKWNRTMTLQQRVDELSNQR